MENESRAVVAIELAISIRQLRAMCDSRNFLQAVVEGEKILKQDPHIEEVVHILARAYSALWSLHGNAGDAKAAGRYLRQWAELNPDMNVKRKAIAHAKEFEAIAGKSTT